MAQWTDTAGVATEQRISVAGYSPEESDATLAEGLAGDDVRPLGNLALLSEAERHRLLVEWNDTAQPYPAHACIHELFEAQVERTPDAVALSSGHEQVSYRELNVRANRLAHRLRQLGVGPEVLVGIHLRRSPAMVSGLLGILKAGGAYVPLDPSYPADRLAFMLEDSRASILVTERQLAGRLPGDTVTPVYLDDGDEVTSDERSENPLDVGCTPENAAYIIYTSGSTGQPKGVVGLHRGAVNRFHWMWQAYPFEPSEICCQKTTLSFVDSIWEIFGPLLQGIPTVLIPDEAVKDPARLVEALADERVTRIVLVPALLRAILETTADLQRLLPDLKIWVTSGEALAPELARSFYTAMPQARLLNLYGQSEASADATCFDTRDGVWDERVSIGRPIANMQLYILDERRQPVPIGQPGELHVSGVGLARGYLHRAELTEEKFIPHPFSDLPGARLYRTGDIARYRSDGNVEYLGRLDHQVKIRGQRVELGEIEAALAQHSAVDRALVMAREDSPGDRRLVAYLVAAPGGAPSVSELRDVLAKKLPEAWIPAAFVALDQFPLTPNGKVDRKALPPPDPERRELGPAFVAPRDRLERQLAEIWEGLLGIRPVGATDSFFELGGHSLLAASLFVEIEQRFGRRLPLATLFQGPTVGDLAAILRQEAPAGGWSPLVPIQPEGWRPPFFCLHSEGGNVLEYEPLARLLGDDQPFYAVQARGLDGSPIGDATIEEMAAGYLRAIRAVQPRGPYYLGGYCLGGVLAFEAARQLRAADEEVGLVAMIQAEAADYPRPAPGTTALHRLADRTWRRFGRELDSLTTFPLGKLQYLRMRARHARTRIQVRFERSVKPLLRRGQPALERSRAHILQALAEAHERAFQRYQPGPYHGRVAIFRARLQPLWIVPDATLGWDRYLENEADLFEVAGYHHTILKEPRVHQLAQALRTSLDHAQAAASFGEADARKTSV